MLIVSWSHCFNCIFQHLFSAVRGRGGYNDHPTTRQAAAAIRNLAANAILQRSTSRDTNCQNEQAVYMNLYTGGIESAAQATADSVTEAQGETETNTPQYKTALPSDDLEGLDDPESSHKFPSLANFLKEKEALTYVLGSTIRRLDCALCSEKLGQYQEKGESEGFVSEMTYSASKLFIPNNALLGCIDKHGRSMVAFINDTFHKSGLVKGMVDAYIKELQPLTFCTDDHKRQFLTFFGRTIVRVLCKEKNAVFSKNRAAKMTRDKFRKLNIL